MFGAVMFVFFVTHVAGYRLQGAGLRSGVCGLGICWIVASFNVCPEGITLWGFVSCWLIVDCCLLKFDY